VSRGDVAFAVANATLATLFVYAAAVNLNDPDPLRWVAMYLGTAITSLAAFSKRLPAAVPIALAAVALTWAAVVAWAGIGESHPMKGFPQVGPLREEVVREGLGLLLVGGWMVVIAVRARRRASDWLTASSRDPRSSLPGAGPGPTDRGS
jgi:hypothetical protein